MGRSVLRGFSRGAATLRAVCAALFLCCGAALAEADHPGRIELQLNVALLADHGALLVDAPKAGQVQDSYLRWPAARLEGDLALRIDARGQRRASGGTSRFAAGLRFRRADGAQLALPELRLGAASHAEWQLTDDRGAVWFSARAGFPLSSLQAARQRLILVDVQAGPALAAWVGSPSLAGESVGRLHLDVARAGLPKGTPACPLNWPGTPGFEVDVALIALYQLQALCITGDCDGGAGGSLQPKVKLTPATTLRNDGTADVPWVGKFLTLTTPGQLELTHPYPQPDQHPMLVWNAYRLDADGRLTQIGRSGLKHAFATENLGCECNPDNHQILGPACSDRYDIGSNDFSNGLAPRSEVIAFDGRWGRCGSLFDPGCVGSQTFTDGPTAHRLLLPEADLDSTRHPQARWFIEAWYVVRDDVDRLNTMGWREFVPQFNGAVWLTPLSGSFQQGSLLDHWATLPFSGDGWSLSQRLQTDRGELHVGIRVTPIDARRARYDYSLLNHSLSRPLTQGAEPNLRVLANPGVQSLAVPLGGSAPTEAIDSHPGDQAAAWTGGCSAAGATLQAPAGQSLEWGSMLRWTVIGEFPPIKGALQVLVTGDPPEQALQAPTLVPGSSTLSIFGDGFGPCG